LLGRLLNEFNNDEIDDLRIKLGWTQDELWSDNATIDERARALVEACTRHGALGSLLRLVESLRPPPS
jgi:hypothetical protein